MALPLACRIRIVREAPIFIDCDRTRPSREGAAVFTDRDAVLRSARWPEPDDSTRFRTVESAF